MFVRVDTDTFININNIFSYKLIDEGDSYKLIIWNCNGNMQPYFFIKNQENQMKMLIEFNNVMRDLVVNPEIIKPVEVQEGFGEIPEEFERVLEEHINKEEEDNE